MQSLELAGADRRLGTVVCVCRQQGPGQGCHECGRRWGGPGTWEAHTACPAASMWWWLAFNFFSGERECVKDGGGREIVGSRQQREPAVWLGGCQKAVATPVQVGLLQHMEEQAQLQLELQLFLFRMRMYC